MEERELLGVFLESGHFPPIPVGLTTLLVAQVAVATGASCDPLAGDTDFLGLWPRTFAYCAAQLLGALTAAAVLRGSLANIAHVGATAPSGSQGQSFLWKFVLSFFLMFVIMAVATDTRAVGEAAAIAVGGTVGLDAMFGGPISGASMNPARSVGPAFVSGDLHALWLYILAPLLGASPRRPHRPVHPQRTTLATISGGLRTRRRSHPREGTCVNRRCWGRLDLGRGEDRVEMREVSRQRSRARGPS
jgi:Major intrinsic protein